MFVIMGITGKVGSAVANTLLDANQPVRAIVRHTDKGKDWAQRGCEIAIADSNDESSLKIAFKGAKGVFVMLPPTYSPSEDFRETKIMVNNLYKALDEARPERIVCLSTIGADATQPNLLNALQILEKGLSNLPIPIAFVRAAWFMENSAWDVDSAVKEGVIQSYLQPLDKPVPMVATADIGRVAAELLQQSLWKSIKIIEIEGPSRVTPYDIAKTFSKLLSKEVRVEAVARDKWESIFIAQGTTNPSPRIQMLNGFNEGWIEFQNGGASSIKGKVLLDTVIQQLLAQKQLLITQKSSTTTYASNRYLLLNQNTDKQEDESILEEQSKQTSFKNNLL